MAQSVTSGANNGAGNHPPEQPPPGMAHNLVGIDENTFRRHMLAIIKANQEVDEARAKKNAARKSARLAGVVLGDMDAIIRMMDWEPGEVRDHFRTVHQYASWANLPLYSQGELFGANIPEAALPAMDWESKGFIAATSPKGAFGKPPDDCPPDQHQNWMKGHERGTKANAAALKLPPTPVEEAAAKAKGSKGRVKADKAQTAAPVEDDTSLDPAVISKKARKLRSQGFTDPAPAEPAADPAPASATVN